MKAYDPSAPLISLHIPKTGGTSLFRILQGWFGDKLIRHYAHNGVPPQRHALTGPICVHGHFNAAAGVGVPQYYPQAEQFMTFLREPFDRYVSQWFAMRRVRTRKGVDPGAGPDFETALRRRARGNRSRRNIYSMVSQFPEPPGPDNFGALMDEKFVFVGIMERYQESLDALAAVLGKPRVEAVRLNKHPSENGAYESLRPFYKKHFTDEYAIYDAGRARNDALIRSCRT
jgi:hypothetical protein